MPAARATVHLLGPMAVTLEDGREITPKGKKARGLIALLATTDKMSRSRRWLEDKLWSDRAPEQASASLRQTLTEIRKCFGECEDLLTADRNDVGLDAGRISTDLEGEKLLQRPVGRDFLEGLNIRDAAFTGWVKEMRVRYPASAPPLILNASQDARSSRLVINCNAAAQSPDRLDGQVSGQAPGQRTDERSFHGPFLGDILSTQIGQCIAEQISASCLSAPLDPSPENAPELLQPRPPSDVDLSCTVVPNGAEASAFVKVVFTPTREVLYSKVHQVPANPTSAVRKDILAKATFEASTAVVDRLSQLMDVARTPLHAANLAQDAVSRIFTFDGRLLAEADMQLQHAHEIDPNPVYFAWRALIRNIQAIETFSNDPAPFQKEAEVLIAHALKDGHDNPLVLSLVALVRVMLFDDAGAGLDLARPAVEKNPNSAFALQSIAMAHMLSGNTESAYMMSQRSHFMASTSRYGHWWDLFHCLACIASHRYDEAVEWGQSAARRAPNFRPPLRNLIALYAHYGERERIELVCKRLLAIEGDFSMERYMEDETYPNRTVRIAGLLNFTPPSLRQIGA